MKKMILPIIGLLFTLNANEINYTQQINELRNKKLSSVDAYKLANAYYHRHLTYTDYQKALKYFKIAKTKKSYYYLAQMYQKGLGVNKNLEKAIHYYKLSNTKEAKYELAKLYLYNKHILKQPRTALSLLKKSAKAGYDKAQLLLGKLYLTNNNLVDKDLHKASKWIYLSAEKGNQEAIKIWDKEKLYKYFK
jgi:TPR repeat protein